MPSIDIVTHDGRTLSAPLPEGMDPSMVTPELVGQLTANAGIHTRNLASQNPDAPTVQGPDGAPDLSPGAVLKSSLMGIGHGVMEAVNQRVVDPLSTIANPKSSWFDQTMAAAGVLGAAMAPELTALGGVAQAGARGAGLGPAGSSLIGAITEIGGGIMQLAKSVWDIGRSARTLMKEARDTTGIAEAAAARGMTVGEKIGQDVQKATQSRFAEMNRQYGARFDAAENQIRAATPSIEPGAPGYADLNGILNYVGDAQASAGPRADRLIGKIKSAVEHVDPETKLPDPQAVRMDDVIALRKILHERAGVSKAFDPDASVVGKKAAELRDRAMDVIRSASPEDVARGYDELRQSARVNLYEPERFVRTLTSQNVSPLKAFKSVFATDDPNVLRTVGETLRENPGAMAKLRFGVVEAMQDALQSGEAGGKALKRLDIFGPTIDHLGLFKPEEMEALRFLLKSNMTPSLVRELTSNARSSQVLLRGTLGANMATHLSSSPLALGIGALAFGGLPQLRRAAMLPAGSAAQRKLLGVVIRNTARTMRSMFSAPAAQAESAS